METFRLFFEVGDDAESGNSELEYGLLCFLFSLPFSLRNTAGGRCLEHLFPADQEISGDGIAGSIPASVLLCGNAGKPAEGRQKGHRPRHSPH